MRPLVLAALAPAAALAFAAVPAAAQGGPFGVAPPNGYVAHGRPGPGHVRPGHVRPGHAHPGRVHAGGRGYGRHGYGYGRYGYGNTGFGYGGYGGYAGGYGAPTYAAPAETVDFGYRIVTAPGIVERPAGRPVVYVLDAPTRRHARGGRHQAYGGAGDPEYGPRVVSLSVPRR